ncbi:MAG TPA: glycosyl hydrolase family 18 protein [Kofleriaceae bacterium]
MLGQASIAIAATAPVVWVNQVNTTVTGATIQKTGGQPDMEDAGAVSQQSIASGDAAFQYTVDETSRFRFVGFGHTSTWQGAASIDYSFRMQAGHADVYEDNSYRTDILVAVGDVLKLEIVGGVARYYKNGALQFTSAQAPVYPLRVATSMIEGSSTISQALISGAPAGAVTWVNRVNTSASGATLQKTGGQPDMEDAGAASQQSIASGNATFQFTIDETSRFRFVGFGHTSTWQGAANIDFSFRLQSGHADVYEHNSYRTDILVAIGDVMKLDISGGVAKYYKNGALQFTSAQAPVYPLYVIASMIEGSSTIAGATIDSGGTPLPPPPAGHHFCGWLAGDGNLPATQDPYFNDFAANAATFDAVHPTWWSVNAGGGGNCCTGGGTFCESFGNPRSTYAPCVSEQVRSNTTYGGKRTKLIPMVAATNAGQVAIVRQMLANSATMDQWVSTLVGFAQSERYDGYDIDFEHLDDGSNPQVRSQLVTFMTRLANALHPLGKTVSIAVGAFDHSDANSMWDLSALANVADQLHVMGYDYHGIGTNHPGPVDPLGWTQAAMVFMANLNNGATVGKLIWGLPNYGVEAPDGQPVIGEPQRGLKVWIANHPGYGTTSTEMASCPFNVDTHYGAGRSPNGFAGGNHAYFDDILSLEEKVSFAQQHGLGGITYWTIGDEPDKPAGQTFFQMVRAQFPQQ